MKNVKSIQSILISLLIIVAFSVSSFAKSGKSTNPENRFKIPKKITCVEDLPEELRQDIKREVIKIQLFPEEIVAEQQEETPSVETVDESMFHVVTGSFNFKENAYKLAENLKNNGYTHTCVEFYNEEGLYRVIVQQYEMEENAEAYLQQFNSENPGYELAWLYQGNKKIEQEILALSQPN